ncbi:MAG: chemotaxis protein CheX [Defluviitaleaceae bacterium]|nr:chemotaxis protein CheX [Defluviitaleaceae bacterium]
MNAAHINPFIQGAQNVFKKLCNESPALGQVFTKSAPYSPSPVAASLSIIGELRGEAIYNMEVADACYIASLMMMGAAVTELDEMSKSAVSELTNMISGNVATLFFGKGIKIDITPPRFIINATPADFTEIAEGEKIVCVPLRFANGRVFEIDISLP